VSNCGFILIMFLVLVESRKEGAIKGRAVPTPENNALGQIKSRKMRKNSEE